MKILRAKTRVKNKYLKGRYYKGTYRGIKCDSRWELAFLLFCLAHGKPIKRCELIFYYTVSGKEHKYFPDFKINNSFYEIKGGHLLKRMLISDTLDNAKYNCMLKNNITIISDCVEYLNYIKEKYGKLFLYSCKCK